MVFGLKKLPKTSKKAKYRPKFTYCLLSIPHSPQNTYKKISILCYREKYM